MWKVAFVVALAVSQVLAAPKAQYVPAGYIENVRSDAPSLRILSGWDAKLGQFPHHAALRMTDAAGMVYACGGSVISRSWVLTAAHCTGRHEFVTVRAGLIQLQRAEYIGESREWYNHPTFNDFEINRVQPNDIALIKLPTPITYSANLRAVRLQSRSDAHRDYAGQVMEVSGHGHTWSSGVAADTLQWVFLRAIANNACAMTYGSALITANSICAGFFNVTSQSTCHGDSGGPLVLVEADGVATQVGVVSFVAGGNFGCHSGLPAGFCRTGPFHSWFTQISGLDFENLDEEDEVTEAPTEPPTTVTEPPTTETEAPTTVTDAPSTTPKPKPPAPEEESEEETDSGEDSDSEEDSEEELDPDLQKLLKKLEVMVKVKVKMSKLGKTHKIKHEHHHNKTITIPR